MTAIYIKFLKLYLKNPNLVPSNWKSIFDYEMSKIQKKFGSVFFGLLKREVDQDIIIAYLVTNILFKELKDNLLKEGYVSVKTSSIPTEFYILPVDIEIYGNYYHPKHNTYVTIRSNNKWFSDNYYLEVYFNKYFDFDVYKEKQASRLYHKYVNYMENNQLRNMKFDYEEDPLSINKFIVKFNKNLKSVEDISIQVLNNYFKF